MNVTRIEVIAALALIVSIGAVFYASSLSMPIGAESSFTVAASIVAAICWISAAAPRILTFPPGGKAVLLRPLLIYWAVWSTALAVTSAMGGYQGKRGLVLAIGGIAVFIVALLQRFTGDAEE